MKCMYESHDENDDLCPFAHSENEILFHPLLLKTRKCRKEYLCSDKYCSFSHSDNDLRVIFNENNDNIKHIFKLCAKFDLFHTNKKK